MNDRDHGHKLKITWDQVDEPNAHELLRQVVRLILNDPPPLSTARGFDKERLTALNEDVPVENEKLTKPDA